MKQRQEAKPLTITASKEVRRWLEAKAKENDRSLNKEVVRILNKAMDAERIDGERA
jgi:predicted HicB family RNase H-like nuclease